MAQTKPFYKRPIFFIPVIVVAIPAIGVAWWRGSPLFLDKTVIEDFPTASAVATTTVGPSPAAPTVPPATVPPSIVAPEGQPPSPAVGDAAVAPIGEPATAVPVETSSEAPEPDTTTTPAPADPIPRIAGMFQDADSRHHGSGDATIYEFVDGSLVLPLENLDITNGPDLHVSLTPLAQATNRADVMADGYRDLGELKGNKGDQNYDIPAGLDFDREWTIVIYCVPFHVIVSTAPLA
jgi:hypothetical protein